MTGRNWFFVAVVRHARQHGGELREWLNEADTAARYKNTATNRDDQARLPRPDGAGTWAEDGKEVLFLLEYDTGTEHLSVLVGKLDGYYVVAAGLAWYEQVCPILLFCFGSPRREQAARRALAASRDADALRIATTAIDPRVTSPAGPVWLPLLGHTGGQVRLIDLDLALPTRGRTTGSGGHANAGRPPSVSRRCSAPTRTTRTTKTTRTTSLPYQAPRPERRSLGIGRDGCALPSR
jgi:Replication-relaxation